MGAASRYLEETLMGCTFNGECFGLAVAVWADMTPKQKAFHVAARHTAKNPGVGVVVTRERKNGNLTYGLYEEGQQSNGTQVAVFLNGAQIK